MQLLPKIECGRCSDGGDVYIPTGELDAKFLFCRSCNREINIPIEKVLEVKVALGGPAWKLVEIAIGGGSIVEELKTLVQKERERVQHEKDNPPTREEIQSILEQAKCGCNKVTVSSTKYQDGGTEVEVLNLGVTPEDEKRLAVQGGLSVQLKAKDLGWSKLKAVEDPARAQELMKQLPSEQQPKRGETYTVLEEKLEEKEG